MPKASDTTKPITIYPTPAQADRIREIAEADDRSMSKVVMRWVSERREMKGVDDGS